MIKKKSSVLLVACSFVLSLTINIPSLAQGQKPAPAFTKIETSGEGTPTTKILFIGQSILFTYNTPHIFHMVASAKRPRENYLIEMVAQGGYSLKDHYEDGTALREIRRERWNYVIIQESTANQIANHKPYEQYAPSFDREARKMGATPIQFECYDESNTDDAHSRMHQEVIRVATALGEPVIPVGSVWRYVTKYHPTIAIFGPDYHHPSLLGTYLMACTIYSKLYKEPSQGGATIRLEYTNPVTHKTEVLDSSTNAQMKLLENAAWTVVKASP
ncbi:MAG: hypothetical protein JST01_15580 [Cyanobacteria bacterium SZAS TMP-1]|nr:hypothetical protein [Cyanobacteria bacterium SZAS TMP-1]